MGAKYSETGINKLVVMKSNARKNNIVDFADIYILKTY